MTSQKHYTASELTKYAIAELTAMGCTVWRANNIAVPGRKFIGMKGMSDIIGYAKDGIATYCEVKTINDKLSKYQIDFMDDALYIGCKVFICMQDKEGVVKFINWHKFHGSLLNPIQSKV